MDTAYKIITGVVLFSITSVLTYLFKMRQLYVVAPNLFKKTEVSASGSICQVMVCNKGNHVEEEITVSIDSSLRIELLATDAVGLSVVNGAVKVDRLHKNKAITALLLIEGGAFDFSKITSVTSKTTVGRAMGRLSELPPNAAKAFLSIICLLAFFPALLGMGYLYSYVRDNYLEYRLRAEYAQGWRNLDNYYGSELSKSYGAQEFPVRFVNLDKNSTREKVVFEVYNKTAIPLQVTADKNHRQKGLAGDFSSVTVPPMSHLPLIVPMPSPDGTSHTPEIEFTFESGDEFIYQFYYSVKEW